MPGGARLSTNDPKTKSPRIFQCYHCNYSTKIKCNLQKHIVNVHVLKKGPSREKSFVCPMCNITTTRVKMIEHYSTQHGVAMNKSYHNFSTMEGFSVWKTKTERDEKACYTVLKGVSKLKSCNVKYYRCHRDGFFHSKGTGKRTLKTKGTNKINGCCPSEMKVMEDQATGQVHVHFVKNHVGHALEVDRLPLLKEDKDKIAEKLAQNVPLNKVLDEVHQNNNGEASERIHLLTRKDVLNIASLYKLKSDVVRKNVEGVGEELDVWIKRTLVGTPVVRLYKPQGELSHLFTDLNESDFVLIAFNDVQIEFLKYYGQEFVCWDRTHSRSGRDFELSTILIVDELRQGFPCAFMLSNRNDFQIMSVFASVLKYHCGNTIECKCFMSDVNDAYYDAWRSEMGTPGCRMFSPWQVDRAWRKSLNKIKVPSKRAPAYKLVKTLTRVYDLDSFEKSLFTVLSNLKTDVDMLPFGEFFEKEFASSYPCWANCYRMNCGPLSSNVHLETMHKTVNNMFLQAKKSKRLDKPIADLMKMIRVKLYEQSIVAHKKYLTEDLMFVKKAHETYLMSFDNELSIDKTPNGWRVSNLALDNSYEVVSNNLSCTCHIRCVICQVCLHSYKCTCPDYEIMWNVCMHIHLTALHIDSKVASEDFVVESKGNEHSMSTMDHQPIDHLEQKYIQVQGISQAQLVHHVQSSNDSHQSVVHQIRPPDIIHQPVHQTLVHQSQPIIQSIQHNVHHSQVETAVHEERSVRQNLIAHDQTAMKVHNDEDDDRSIEVLQICDSNVAPYFEDLIFKQYTNSSDGDSELKQAKGEALKLVQDIFDAVETRTQLEVFTNAILPVLPTITAMKYSGSCYK